jgi:hypothetical protein
MPPVLLVPWLLEKLWIIDPITRPLSIQPLGGEAWNDLLRKHNRKAIA